MAHARALHHAAPVRAFPRRADPGRGRVHPEPELARSRSTREHLAGALRHLHRASSPSLSSLASPRLAQRHADASPPSTADREGLHRYRCSRPQLGTAACAVLGGRDVGRRAVPRKGCMDMCVLAHAVVLSGASPAHASTDNGSACAQICSRRSAGRASTACASTSTCTRSPARRSASFSPSRSLTSLLRLR